MGIKGERGARKSKSKINNNPYEPFSDEGRRRDAALRQMTPTTRTIEAVAKVAEHRRRRRRCGQGEVYGAGRAISLGLARPKVATLDSISAVWEGLRASSRWRWFTLVPIPLTLISTSPFCKRRLKLDSDILASTK